MGIDGTNSGNPLDRIAAFKQAVSKGKTPSQEKDSLEAKPISNLVSSFKFPAISADEKAQVLKSTDDIAAARGDDDLNTQWASTGSDIKFDPISVKDPSIKNFDDDTASALAKLDAISDDALRESDTYNQFFNINQEGIDS